MPTVFKSLSYRFYTAFFEPDSEKRQEKIDIWIDEATPIIQDAVKDELRKYIDGLLEDSWTEKPWKIKAEKYFGDFINRGDFTLPFIDAYQLQLNLQLLRSESIVETIVGEITPEIRDETIQAIDEAKTAIAILFKPDPIKMREIDLHPNPTVEEAIPILKSFLKNAYRDNVRRVRVIHGKGEGVLRDAVRECLDQHPFVTSISIVFANTQNGGEGATEANLVTFKPELLDHSDIFLHGFE